MKQLDFETIFQAAKELGKEKLQQHDSFEDYAALNYEKWYSLLDEKERADFDHVFGKSYPRGEVLDTIA